MLSNTKVPALVAEFVEKKRTAGNLATANDQLELKKENGQRAGQSSADKRQKVTLRIVPLADSLQTNYVGYL